MRFTLLLLFNLTHMLFGGTGEFVGGRDMRGTGGSVDSGTPELGLPSERLIR